MAKKEPQKCRYCGVELSAKEFFKLHNICFVCSSDEQRKDDEFRKLHGGVVRQGR